MKNNNQFGAADSVEITILVDNHADLIVKSTENVKYFTDKPLLAEHGFSALIHFPPTGLKILWDAGITPLALMENIKRLEIETNSINKIVLSHGHRDHHGALTEFMRSMSLEVESKEWDKPFTSDDVDEWIASERVPVIAHPAAFRERWWVKEDGTKVGPVAPPPQLEWEALGANLVFSEKPHCLGPGCWTTGYIPRRSFEKSGRPTKILHRDGSNFIQDDLEEDQAIVINIEDKGLVVVSGCAHSGIVNTVDYAREISNIDRVHAILGGFHLARANDEEIQNTIDSLKDLSPEILVPCHCTGFKAMSSFSQMMPDAFYHGIVGATYIF